MELDKLKTIAVSGLEFIKRKQESRTRLKEYRDRRSLLGKTAQELSVEDLKKEKQHVMIRKTEDNSSMTRIDLMVKQLKGEPTIIN
jgi:hypothetical protein